MQSGYLEILTVKQYKLSSNGPKRSAKVHEEVYDSGIVRFEFYIPLPPGIFVDLFFMPHAISKRYPFLGQHDLLRAEQPNRRGDFAGFCDSELCGHLCHGLQEIPWLAQKLAHCGSAFQCRTALLF